MEDFTAANIAVSDEKREEEMEKVKRGKVDYSKLEAEVEEAKSNALEVSGYSAVHYLHCKMLQASPCFWSFIICYLSKRSSVHIGGSSLHK